MTLLKKDLAREPRSFISRTIRAMVGKTYPARFLNARQHSKKFTFMEAWEPFLNFLNFIGVPTEEGLISKHLLVRMLACLALNVTAHCFQCYFTGKAVANVLLNSSSKSASKAVLLSVSLNDLIDAVQSISIHAALVYIVLRKWTTLRQSYQFLETLLRTNGYRSIRRASFFAMCIALKLVSSFIYMLFTY